MEFFNGKATYGPPCACVTGKIWISGSICTVRRPLLQRLAFALRQKTEEIEFILCRDYIETSNEH